MKTHIQDLPPLRSRRSRNQDTRSGGWRRLLSPGALVLLLATGSASAQLSDGLVNYWNFDGTLDDWAPTIAGNASTVDDNGVLDGANGTGGIGYTAGLFGEAID